MDYYGDDCLNWVMSNNKMHPLYAGLARKVISHYLGDLYNPHTFNTKTEAFIRGMIKDAVKMKVFDKEPYDKPFLDNFFRWVLHDSGYDHIMYDLDLINKGYNGVIRSELPTHSA